MKSKSSKSSKYRFVSGNSFIVKKLPKIVSVCLVFSLLCCIGPSCFNADHISLMMR